MERSQGQGLSPPRETGTQGPRDPGTGGSALHSAPPPLCAFTWTVAVSQPTAGGGPQLLGSKEQRDRHFFASIPKSSWLPHSCWGPQETLLYLGWGRGGRTWAPSGGVVGRRGFPRKASNPGGSKHEGGVGPESIHRNHKSWAADCGDLNAGYLYIKCQCVLAFGWPSLSGRLSEKTCPTRTLPGQPSSGGAETGPPQVWSANQKHQHRSGRIGMYQKCRFLSPVLDLAEPLRLLQPWDWFWQLSFENCGAEETGN